MPFLPKEFNMLAVAVAGFFSGFFMVAGLMLGLTAPISFAVKTRIRKESLSSGLIACFWRAFASLGLLALSFAIFTYWQLWRNDAIITLSMACGIGLVVAILAASVKSAERNKCSFFWKLFTV